MQFQIEYGSVSLAIDVYRRLKHDRKNLIISPFSLTTALSMTLMGCRNRTAEELSKALFCTVYKPDKFKPLAHELAVLNYEAIKANDKFLSMANFIYPQRGFGLRLEFNQILEKYFASKAVEVNYTEVLFLKRREAVDTINQDISKATRGKIPQLLQKVPPDTKLIVASAAHFKGFWKSKFQLENTKKRAFTLSNGEVIQVDMMQQNSKQSFCYNNELKCKAIQLPYENSNTSLVILLPDTWTSLKRMESLLSPPLMDKIIKSMKPYEVNIFLPKFKLNQKHSLVPVLKQLGVTDLFSPAADISGMVENSFKDNRNVRLRLNVSYVIQQAGIEVNEEGAESAPEIGVANEKGLKKYDQVEFKVDRPFLFLLVSHCQDRNLILLMGAVEDPRN